MAWADCEAYLKINHPKTVLGNQSLPVFSSTYRKRPVVIKYYAREEKMERAAEFLNILRKMDAAPRVLGYTRDEKGPALVMSFVGDSLLFEDCADHAVTAAQYEKISTQLKNAVARLTARKIRIADFHFLVAGDRAWIIDTDFFRYVADDPTHDNEVELENRLATFERCIKPSP